MAKKRNIYIGVAWPYVNDLFHIGNLAGAYLPPDIFARFHKLRGNDVLMVSGSDFHGTPITLRADKEGKKPEEVAQRFHELDKKYLKKFKIDYTLFTSTHTPNHKQVTQDMFLKLLKQGYIQIQKTEQLYSTKAKKFLQDRYVEGECPYCGFKKARGDQCDECGKQHKVADALNGIDIGLVHPFEELPGVGREALHVPTVSLGVDGVEGERGLARPRQPGDHHQLVARDVHVDVLQIVLARPAHLDEFQLGHTASGLTL